MSKIPAAAGRATLEQGSREARRRAIAGAGVTAALAAGGTLLAVMVAISARGTAARRATEARRAADDAAGPEPANPMAR